MSWLQNALSSINSPVENSVWPVVPSREAALALSLLQQIQSSEKLDPAELYRRQMAQLHTVVSLAARETSFYSQSIPPVPDTLEGFMEYWQSVPVLSREQLQAAGDQILSKSPPRGHQLIGTRSTSGSTGMPVKVYSSNISRIFWMITTVRTYLWQGWDFSRKLGSIRPELEAEVGQGVRSDSWGKSSSLITRTGPGIALSVRTSIERQIEWLETERPDYLLSLPTNLRALREAGADLSSLLGVQAFGELLDDPTRETIEAGMPWRIFDGYSSQEVGNMTIQCEEYNHHVVSDCVLFEVLDDSGSPCAPGETGRVVVTTLQNAVAPLIRYAIGDYAVMGESCPCGRTLPVVKNILGRKRNMVRLPDGSIHWPSFPQKSWAEGIPIKQFQLIQSSPDTIDVKIVARGAIGPVQEEKMRRGLQGRLGYPFAIQFSYVDQIPRSAGGKYEDFVSLLA